MFNNWRIPVAVRLFGHSAGNRLISFVGLLSIGGLTLAVAVLLTVLSVVNGFERELRERVLAVLPHATLYSRDKRVDWIAEQARIDQYPEVLGSAPVVEGAGLLLSEGVIQGVSFRGIDTAQEARVSILPEFVLDDGFERMANTRFGTLVGVELARSLDLTTGDQLTLVLPDVSLSLAGPGLTTKRLTVAGLFEVGADIDNRQIYLNIDDARRLKRQRDIDGLVIRSRDLFTVHEVLYDIVTSSPSELYGVSWMRQHGNLYDAIATQKATLFLLLLILVAVAAFNVVSNLVMTVDDNRAEIAILRTMGATPHDIRVIFIIHGLLVGMTGLVLGLMLGLVLTASLGTLYGAASSLFGLQLMSEYFIRYLPTDVQLADILAISGVSLVISFVATIYPAGRAASASPVEALQYEV